MGFAMTTSRNMWSWLEPYMAELNKEKETMNLGDRMKENYENRSRFFLTRKVPVIIRLDGRAFHTFTKNMIKPFDSGLIGVMLHSALATAKEMQGFKLGYVQSDEASFLLTDYDNLEATAWFDYNLSKMTSISASIMTGEFRRVWVGQTAHFDSRAFNVPKEDVANYFLWRALDWERNSLSMYCQSFFSHKELQGKNRADQHEMLHKIGKNWADLSDHLKNGTFITKSFEMRTDILPAYDNILTLLEGSL